MMRNFETSTEIKEGEMKVLFFDSPDEILRKARQKYGKHKKFILAEWPGEVKPRLIMMNDTVNDPEDFNED